MSGDINTHPPDFFSQTKFRYNRNYIIREVFVENCIKNTDLPSSYEETKSDECTAVLIYLYIYI